MKLSSKANWNLYRCFIATYEAGGYSQAVKYIDVARNNIKANVDTLSRQLGVDLFISNSKGVKPTSHAVKIYPAVKNAVETLIREEESLKEFTTESEAIIRMIIPMTMVATVWRNFFKDFKKKYPNIQFEFLNRGNIENYNEFLLGQVDLVIDLDHGLKSHSLQTIELMECNPVFIATKEFLTKNNLSEKINTDELSKYQLIAHNEHVQKIKEETGNNPIIFIKTANLEATRPLVEIGAGTGIYPKEFFDNRENKFIQLNSDITISAFKIVCGYNKQTISKAAQVFIDELVKFCSLS